MPIAERTWLQVYDCDVQAAPFEMATRSDHASIAASDSMPGIVRFRMFGSVRA